VFCKFYNMENHKIANNLVTEAREKKYVKIRNPYNV
jgi:hypothetical protein